MAAVLGAAAAVLAQEPEQGSGAPGEPNPRFQPLPVPRTMAKRRGNEQIYIDGVLQDWPAAPPILLDDARLVSGTALGAWRGPADLAARAFLLWDDDDLYFSAVVRDDWHRPLAAESPRLLEIPPADNIVLSFDPNRDTRAIGYDEGRREDREFWLADVEGQGRRVVQWDRLRGTARYADGALAVVLHDREKGLTTYEARLPWKEILPPGHTAHQGDVFDLQIVVNDYDEITDLMPQTRIGWTFGTGPSIDPGLHGSVMLAGGLDQAEAAIPEFPPGPPMAGDPVPGPKYLDGLYQKLRAAPVAVSGEDQAPELAGGAERLAVLREIDRLCSTFPRVDNLEYHQRVARRMRRETSGMAASGLPYLWRKALADVAERGAAPVPAGALRVFRLPTGGFLVRSDAGNFAIDASGMDVETLLWGGLDFMLLTSPHDITKRNDQVLLRMAAAKRKVFAHRAFHVPGTDVADFPLVEVGKSYTEKGLVVRVLGVVKDTLVSEACGYEVRWPNGLRLAVVSDSCGSEADWGAPLEGIDVLLLSARHPLARQLGQRTAAGITVLDDVMVAPSSPQPRVSLDEAFALQTGLRPRASVLLAPGDAIDVPHH